MVLAVAAVWMVLVPWPTLLRRSNSVPWKVAVCRDVVSCSIRSKSATRFASADTLKEFQARHGGTVGDFNEALKQSYLDMAADVAMIRKNREERRQKAMQKQG